MLDFVNEMLKKRTNKSNEDLYTDLQAQLQKLKQNPFEQFVFEYFDFLSWAKSKVNGKKFREQLAAWESSATFVPWVTNVQNWIH